MSILIKGLKMPKRCGECIFDVYSCGGCLINLNTEHKNELTHSCPLVELPDHGDLIDRDALSREMYHEAFETDSALQKWDGGCWIRYKMFEKHRDAAPVVIPAERSEE